MLIWFNNKGIVKEQLDSYGNLPRVGSQKFQIFAYFDGIEDIFETYGAAYIRLTRPDLTDSEYPILFMSQANLTYQPAEGSSLYFKINGGPNLDGEYPCYLFDFEQIKNIGDPTDPSDDSIVTLLDTPGLWQATITLVSTSSSATNVVGTFTFYVEGAVDIEEETQLSYSIVFQNMAAVVAQKLNANSSYYLRTVDGFPLKATNKNLIAGLFVNGIIVFDRTTKTFYKITSIIPKENDSEHVGATYDKIVSFEDKLDITAAIVVLNDISQTDLTDFELGQLFYDKETKAYYHKIISEPDYELAGNLSGILGSERTIPKYYLGGSTPGAINDFTFTFADLYSMVGIKTAIIYWEGYEEDYLVRMSSDTEIFAHSLTQPGVYYYKSRITTTDLVVGLFSQTNKVEMLRKQTTPVNSVYAINISGQQVNIPIDDIMDSFIAEVATNQSTFSFIEDVLTNINSYSSADFDYDHTTISGVLAYKIITAGTLNNLTKEQASTYLKNMTGSGFVPEYGLQNPCYSYMIMPDGTILQPLYDNVNGLVLYKKDRFAKTDYVDNNILTLTTGGGTLTNEQYAYCLKKNARVFYSATGVYYEKFLEDSTKIAFKAINPTLTNNSGTVTVNMGSGLIVTKATKVFGFAMSSSESFYNTAKMDSDFATKNYVDRAIDEVKQNSLQNVDTDEYPTLQDFLDSEGEEGYIYLYPIDLSDLTKGYYRYIWEYVPADDAYEWEYLGTTEIDLSDFEVTFEQETFNNGVVAVEFKNNTDYQLISLVDTVSVALTIPSGISQGWIGSCTFTVGNTIPSFTLTNNSIYNVVFIVNNRKTNVYGIALNLDTNGIVECLAECNGFDIRVYMKEVTN